MFGPAGFFMPFRASPERGDGRAGLPPVGGLEVMSTISVAADPLPLLLGKWYMFAVLMVGVEGGGGVEVGKASPRGLSSFARLLEGDKGTVAAEFGFCWELNSSLMVFPGVCLRFLSPDVDDIEGEADGVRLVLAADGRAWCTVYEQMSKMTRLVRLDWLGAAALHLTDNDKTRAKGETLVRHQV